MRNLLIEKNRVYRKETCEMLDYLIVGAGLAGAVFARVMSDEGYKCMVIDKRNHIAGNVYSTEIEGIEVHQY